MRMDWLVNEGRIDAIESPNSEPPIIMILEDFGDCYDARPKNRYVYVRISKEELRR